jgi:hypothetical protein
MEEESRRQIRTGYEEDEDGGWRMGRGRRRINCRTDSF